MEHTQNGQKARAKQQLVVAANPSIKQSILDASKSRQKPGVRD